MAGDSALDLLNTVEWRLDTADREEDLESYADVLDWCVESGLLEVEERERLSSKAGGAEERDRVVALREDAYAALIDHDATAAARILAAYREAIEAAELQLDDDWRIRDRRLSVSTPRHRIARALLDLFRRDDLDRLHQCEDARCGWVYLDRSPRRNRRWCVASDCGDRNRARAYYARKTGK